MRQSNLKGIDIGRYHCSNKASQGCADVGTKREWIHLRCDMVTKKKIEILEGKK
jgi:hypothetical protein